MDHETLALAKALIHRRSVTPADEGCQDLVIERLLPLGFRPETMNHGAASNLLIRHGTTRPLLVFAGHTDVVAPGPLEKWASDPFEPTERDGLLFGRGAGDMKGALAAFVVAAERYVRANPGHPGTLALLLTSDEEGAAVDGTARVVQEMARRGEAADYCVLGQPSSTQRFGDTLKIGRRGILTGNLSVRGVAGHAAYAHRATNPVHLAAPAIAELAATHWDAGTAHFIATSWQVSNIHAGRGAQNIIPGVLQVDFNFRFSAGIPPESLRDRLEAILRKHGLEFSIEWSLAARPYLTPGGRLVETMTAVVEEVSGMRPALDCAGGTSDGRFLIDVCPEVVEFGPVSRSIHKANEAVALDELEPLTRVYELAITRLLAAA